MDRCHSCDGPADANCCQNEHRRKQRKLRAINTMLSISKSPLVRQFATPICCCESCFPDGINNNDDEEEEDEDDCHCGHEHEHEHEHEHSERKHKQKSSAAIVDPRAASMEYRGHCLAPGEKIEIVETHTLTPKQFYDRFISTRKPAILRGLFKEKGWKCSPERWTNAFLRKRAGDVELKIEYRDNLNQTYGLAQEKNMMFKDFLKEIESGSQLLYLTTQDLGVDEAGRPYIVGAPLDKFLDEIPLRPALCPTLVPFNLNLWMGRAKKGSTTGLHHDFHDNIYVLLRGRKRFRLLSPEWAPHLKLRGKLTRVHPNGRFNYEGLPTAEDGSNVAAALADEEEALANEELAKAEEAVERNEPGAKQRLKKAEKRLERALMAVLEAEKNDDYLDDDDDDEDDDEDDEDEDMPLFSGKPPGDDSEEDEEDRALEMALQQRLLQHQQKKSQDKKKKNAPKQPAANGGALPDTPINFCNIDPFKPEEELRQQHPEYCRAPQTMAELSPGDMLYLPAGWFHEVSSFDEHMALNYWFHPPVFGSSFEKPYDNNFWERSFANIVASSSTLSKSN